MAKNYGLNEKGLRKFIKEEAIEADNNKIYSNSSNFRYNNNNQMIEGNEEDGQWVTMRTYCIPPYKRGYGDNIQSYYQVVRKNLELVFEELEEMREVSNTEVITKEISDACYIADNVLTFISAQADRIKIGYDDKWTDIHSITDIFKDAAQAGKEKTIDVTPFARDKEKEIDWFSKFLDKFKDLFELPGDYFAIDRPAWDATMKKVNKELVQDGDFSQDSVGKVGTIIDKKGNLDTSQFNPEILKYGLEMLLFYKKEVVLNAISAEVMYGFMLRGLTLIENVRNLALTPLTLARVLRGLLDILVAPEVGGF
ncbi:hypothetical protein [Halanaerobacter jeridensis]|uniref:Uncharacterized protein n=1 Tax=Halanaerobacter jeridensis TaxID=706427 RepID=A0A939BMW1_9FIRM|nr:hypothetical protein [Halanaerobacter jeridensis]MBM7557630.1 hypothetical protein [Halanaerobacter jeridensis]